MKPKIFNGNNNLTELIFFMPIVVSAFRPIFIIFMISFSFLRSSVYYIIFFSNFWWSSLIVSFLRTKSKKKGKKEKKARKLRPVSKFSMMTQAHVQVTGVTNLFDWFRKLTRKWTIEMSICYLFVPIEKMEWPKCANLNASWIC